MKSLYSIIININKQYWFFYTKTNTIIHYIIKEKTKSKILFYRFFYKLMKQNKLLFKKNINNYYRTSINNNFYNYLIRNKFIIFFKKTK